MEEVTNTKSKSIHFKRWCELSCNKDGSKYLLKICSNKKAIQNNDPLGKEVLKEIELDYIELVTLSEFFIGLSEKDAVL